VTAHLLIREYYACFNERRFADAADLFTEDAVLERLPFGTFRNGGNGYIQMAQRWVDAFPDAVARIDHVEQRGDTICEVDLVMTGTHSGDLDLPGHGLFKASGRTVALWVSELLEIRARKITYGSISFDELDLVRQLSGRA
jgi:predicted ester cyclase